MAWTYVAADIASNTTYQVRRLIGDVLTTDQQLQDEEIAFAVTSWSNVYLAAAECARNISAQYSRRADVVQGEVSTRYSQLASAYAARAIELDQIGKARSGASMPFAGGISVAQKRAQQADSDWLPPNFNYGLDDNLNMPTGPIETQVPTPEGGEQL